jgi:hypothetical protein
LINKLRSPLDLDFLPEVGDALPRCLES